jgi:hypothetical protein
MIEVLHPGPARQRDFLPSGPFKAIQKIVGGYVECVHVREGGMVIQVLCDEEGLLKSPLPPYNEQVAERFADKINFGNGPVGTWVVLSGRDRLK